MPQPLRWAQACSRVAGVSPWNIWIGSSGVWSLAAREKSEGVASADKKVPARKPRRGGEPHIGQALRSVWDETLGEQIPADMLDLLGKLN